MQEHEDCREAPPMVSASCVPEVGTSQDDIQWLLAKCTSAFCHAKARSRAATRGQLLMLPFYLLTCGGTPTTGK